MRHNAHLTVLISVLSFFSKCEIGSASAAFWDVTLCAAVEASRNTEETIYFHLPRYKATRFHVRKSSNIHNDRRENFRSDFRPQP